MKIYTLEYKLHGNTWRIKVMAETVKNAKKYASASRFMPSSRFKNVGSVELFHNTFGAERVYK